MEKNTMKYDYFMKMKLQELTVALLELCETDDDSEGSEILKRIEKLRFCIDKNLYDKIDKFIKIYISPSIFGWHKELPYGEEIEKVYGNLKFEDIWDMRWREVEKFADENIRPILTA